MLIVSLLKRFLLPFGITVGAILLIKYISGHSLSHIMGPLWFLLALFWARMVYGFVSGLGRRTLPLALIIGFAAYILSLCWIENRAFIVQGLCAIPFIAIGKSVNKLVNNQILYEKYKWWIRIGIAVCIVCWVLTLAFSHLEMRACSFGCWPLDILGACGGTLVLWFIAKYLLKNKYICNSVVSKAIIWCGRFSMAILCMHALEWKALLPLEESICSGQLLLPLRFIITIVLSAIVVYTPVLKKIYR